ncbi:thiol-disulfide oxidoreductase ResA [Brevibacillus daliensis]|uniref:thiol-disulfide oxidoreductase ResA n=1 Tax=Brevibacillus daliensis TaxID=2892995 RepID=UPI001E4BBBC0|nr:thiol-disulfide oxidoreductase ResA [Brevibacillus daliensis]
MGKEKRIYMRIGVLGILLIALVFAIYSSISKPGLLKVGDEAPNFSLKDREDKNVTLADLKGKTVILNFWGTWCEPCRNEMPALEKIYQKYKSDDVVVIGLNVGEAKLTAEQFIRQVEVTFPIWFDSRKEVTKRYSVGKMPTTYFIDKDGVIRVIKTGEMTERVMEQLLSETKQ